MWPIPSPQSQLSRIVDRTSGAHETSLQHALDLRNRFASLRKKKELSWIDIVRALDEYLPYAVAISNGLLNDSLVSKQHKSTDILWTSPYSQQTAGNESFLVEVSLCTVSYAIALRNHATHTYLSLGTFELQSSQEIANANAQLAHVSSLICKASGILQYAGTTLASKIEQSVGPEELKHIALPECQNEFCRALSKICIAEANLVAVRRLLSHFRSQHATLVLTALPLPKDFPSPSLLGKVYLKVSELYDDASGLLASLKIPSKPLKARLLPGKPHISTEKPLTLLRRELDTCSTMTRALAYKWIGVEVGERGSPAEAIVWLKASDALARKNKAARKMLFFQAEADTISDFIKNYEAINASLHFETLPPESSVLHKLPASRAVLEPTSYTPPSPAFSHDLSVVVEPAESEPEEAVYFGAGSYF